MSVSPTSRPAHVEPKTLPVLKRTARAVLLDGPLERPTLVLIKRTRGGLPPYWITPGGGVDAQDPSVRAALHRELDEELGARVTHVVPAFLDTEPHTDEDGTAGVKVQYFFACRLATMDLTRRHGPEVDAPDGSYEVVRLPFTRDAVGSVDVVSPALSRYLRENLEGVLDLLRELPEPR